MSKTKTLTFFLSNTLDFTSLQHAVTIVIVVVTIFTIIVFCSVQLCLVEQLKTLIMKKQLFLLLLFCFLISKVHSQNSVIVAGGDAIGTGGKVSYSIGQIAYTYASGTNGSVNQGVQQPFEISTLGIDDFPNITLEMTVYPNPTTNFVSLKISELSNNLSFQLFDISGKLISNKKISDLETQISFDNLNAAIYLIQIIDNNKTIKTFKIIKN
jgi:hypothetical protein